MRLPDPDASTLVRVHFLAILLWSVLLLPTLLWWKQSLVWIVVMSWYANWVGHWSAWDAARAEQANDGGT